MIFKNRAAAGKLLFAQVASYRGTDTVVCALPRGGVVIGYEIAHALKLPIDIVAVRKIGHPDSPEYAIGAVDERGEVIWSEEVFGKMDRAWLEEKTDHELQEALRRSIVYRDGTQPIDIDGKIVLLVDDGIATGLTMELAIESTKKQLAKKIVVAVPVAPRDAVEKFKKVVDEVIVLAAPEDFLGSIGAHYIEFPQVTDEEVLTLMRESHANATGGSML
jgi:putative phosphoribosyl transferase